MGGDLWRYIGGANASSDFPRTVICEVEGVEL
jgi:hypothetical protein